MRIDILTLFPKMFSGPFEESILRRAQDKSLVEIHIHQLRDWAVDRHKTVDGRPYGGGAGMVLMIEPIYQALKSLKSKIKNQKSKVILLDPGGKVFDQAKARQLAKLEHLVLIAGHYETADHRVREHLIDEELSIGDYVLTGGELPAMVIADAVVRLIPGVLEKPEATQFESFSESKIENLLEYPQYTRPEVYRSWKVPEVLLSGNHKEIERWKKEQATQRTRQNRPDLLKD